MRPGKPGLLLEVAVALVRERWKMTELPSDASNVSTLQNAVLTQKQSEGAQLRWEQSMSDHDEIGRSLELIAKLHGAPTDAVCARLLSQQPRMEALFLPGRDQSKGSMLAIVLDLISDSTGRNNHGLNLLRAEIMNHQGLGVPPTVFMTFLDVVRETFAELLDDRWTSAMDDAWSRAISDLKSATPIIELA